MSRDLTPRELLALEKYMIENDGLSIMEMKKGLKVSYGGSECFVYDENKLEKQKEYPLIGKLYNLFDKLYVSLKKINGLDILQNYEMILQDYVNGKHDNENELVVQWFLGKLDPGFYYSEQNDERFYEATIEQVIEQKLEAFGYIKTDFFQYQKKISEQVFRMVGVVEFPDRDYAVYGDLIDLETYSKEEIADIMESYYSSMEEFAECYPEKEVQNGLIAECVFESMEWWDAAFLKRDVPENQVLETIYQFVSEREKVWAPLDKMIEINNATVLSEKENVGREISGREELEK